MFGVALYLGDASNNYAEYVGLILAQLILCMFKHTNISIVTDSTLVVNQVKGVAQTKNFRLVELIKVVRIYTIKAIGAFTGIQVRVYELKLHRERTE